MKIQSQIETLETLAAIDAELAQIDEQLTQERQALTQKKELLGQLETRGERSRQNLEQMERTRNELVAEVRQMGVQVEKSREKLSRCRTEREANAAQRELEELRKLLRDREVEIEKLAELIETARADVQKTESERSTLSSELGASESDVTTKLQALEQELQAKTENRKQLQVKVTPVVYRRYELVRKRRGSAIASVVDGICSACHIHLPPMAYRQLLRGDDFGQCPSCNRIIYVKPAALEAEQPGSSSSSA